MQAFTCVETSLFWGRSWMAGCLSCLGAVVSLALTWQKLGKRRGRCQSQVPSASPLLPAFPVLERQPIPSGQKTATPCLYHVCCSMHRDRQLQILLPSFRWCAVPCPGEWKDAGTFQERQSRGLTLCFNLLLGQICWGEGVLFCRSVDLCDECSAQFLLETWEGRREEDLFGFFYGLCFQ